MATSRKAAASEVEVPAVTEFRRGLTTLALGDQKSIFNNLQPALQAALWTDRLQEALEGELSREQKSVLQKIVKRLTPAAYEHDSVQRKRFEKFWQEMRPVALAAFAPDVAGFKALSTRLGEPNRAARFAQAFGPPPCDCALAGRGTDLDDCWFFSNCKAVPCAKTRTGCGSFWLSPCTGICT
jgi:hypothetical protein